MQRSEGVNDLWSAPAADVGGMEVNRDEVFIYRASAYMTDPSNAPLCVRAFLFRLQWKWESPFP